MKHAIKLFGVGVFVTALASLALCQEPRVYREGSNWVQETTGSLGAAKNLHVKLEAGEVKVQGGSQSGITYVIRRRSNNSSEEQSRHEFESYKISASVKGDTAWIVSESEGRRNHKGATDVVINVPRDLQSARIETGGGGIEAAGIAGRADLESGGGHIHVDDIGGEVAAETGGGSIEIGKVESGVSLHTGGGNITVASAKGEIKAESGGGNIVVRSGTQGAVLQTGGGSIRVEKCGGQVKATTGGGSVEIGEIGGPAELETGGGNIRLASAKGRVRAQTGGGGIEVDGATSVQAETGAGGITAKLFSSGGAGGHEDSSLETSTGDITVYLANDVAISIRAEIESANGQTIHSDFQEIHVSTEGGQYGPKTVTAEGQLNGGGPVLKVRTNLGNVNFRRVSH
ncbi:MAG: DUF4097 family beta strand repeat-containing protein [Terriglobales bacterium]